MRVSPSQAVRVTACRKVCPHLAGFCSFWLSLGVTCSGSLLSPIENVTEVVSLPGPLGDVSVVVLKQ